MFDYLPTPPLNRETASPKIFGRRFIEKWGARLVLASSRLGGEEGVALAWAFRDMILDTGVHPLHWPIGELIDLLRKPAARRDGQIEQMVRRLERIRQETDRLAVHDARHDT